jgi:DNA-binding MarR family transcriptional regulator
MSRYVPGMINHLSNKLSRGASALYRERFGIGIIEWRILSQLAIAPGSSARSICEITGLDKAAVSRSFEVLRMRRLVTFPRTTGRREQFARLSHSGRRLHDQIIEIALERERRLLAPLSLAERQTLIALLGRIHAGVDAVNAPYIAKASDVQKKAPRRVS